MSTWTAFAQQASERLERAARCSQHCGINDNRGGARPEAHDAR